MGTVDLINDLAKALEVFFKGLSDCGLLTTYAVHFEDTTVNLAVLIKFRRLMYQFMKSIQALLLKTPIISSHESSHGINTQIPSHFKTNFVEVNLPGSSESIVTEQLGSLVEACVFSQSDDPLSWTETRGRDGTKAGFVSENNELESTDIIVTCHPAALAAITGHNFITSTTEPVLSTDCSSVKNDLLKVCGDTSCTTEVVEEQSCIRENGCSSESTSKIKSESVVPQNNDLGNKAELSSEQHEIENSVKNQLNPVTVSELKPFITTNTTRSLTDQLSATTLKSLSGQEMEPLVLQTYTEDDGQNEIEGSKFTLEDSTNVMHIVVASTDQQRQDGVTTTETEGDENDSAIFICEVCENTFVSAHSLEIHLSLKHRNKGQCDMCSLRFGSVQSLQEHCRTDHGGTGCFNCPMCNRRFMTKLSYKRHMDTHWGKKGAVCDMCGKTFSRTDYLQKHYMTHNGNRPFTCPHCPRKFISSSQLKVHERIHSGVKEHVCDMCNKAFSRGDKLKDHMLRHLNIKRFQCAICKREFAEKRDLNKHIKRCSQSCNGETEHALASESQVLPVIHLQAQVCEEDTPH